MQVATPINAVTVTSFMAILPLLLTLDEIELVTHITRFGGEHDIQLIPFAFISGSARMVVMLAFAKRQQIDHRLALASDAGFRQAPHFQLVGHAGGEEQHRRMGEQREQAGDEILVPRRHAGRPAAASLPPIFGDRSALDIAGMGDGDGDILALLISASSSISTSASISSVLRGVANSARISPSSALMMASTRPRDDRISR